MPTIRLIKSEIDRIPLPREGRVDYYDSELQGFLLRVSPHSRVYYAWGRLGGKKLRLKIGPHGVFTPELARNRAKELLVALAQGIDPRGVKREQKAQNLTLKEALEDYLQHRDLKPTTQKSYRYTVGYYLKDWMNHPLSKITREGVLKKHREVTEAHGPVPANYAFRILRGIFNFVRAKNEGPDGTSPFRDNPVAGLSTMRAWNREHSRRENFIRESDLPAWGQAVRELPNSDIRDYLLLLLLTGLRRREAATLQWKDIDFLEGTLTVKDTKNRKPHVLPLSNVLKDLLLRRKKEAKSVFIFPGPGRTGHLVEPKKSVEEVRRRSGVNFTLHDLRRTFTVIAQGLVPYPALKRLLNHASGGDVTLHNYAGADLKTLRGYMETIDRHVVTCLMKEVSHQRG